MAPAIQPPSAWRAAAECIPEFPAPPGGRLAPGASPDARGALVPGDEGVAIVVP